MDIEDAQIALAAVLADPTKIKSQIDALKAEIKEKTGKIKQLQLLYRAATATKREYKKREKKAPAPVPAAEE